MKKFLLLICLIVAICIQESKAQDRLIIGKVTNKTDGSGIPGVSVVVKGTTIGTTTDLEGNYKISVGEKVKKLVFNAIGMKRQELELSASPLDVVMEEDVLKLNEVVVTALGIEKESRSIGYSQTQIGGDNLMRARSMNVVTGLAGKSSGIQVNTSGGTPGASSKIILRGNRSFGDNQPIFVIDGVPMDNSTNSTNTRDNPFNANLEQVNYSNRAVDINPDDIENITVLKGPAAAALYGTRGASGAIIITTKKAKFGSKTEVTISSNIQIETVNKLPKLQNKYAQGVGGGDIAYGSDSAVLVEYLPGPNGYYEQGGGDDIDGTSQSWGPSLSSLGRQSFDNVGKFFKTGITYTNSISVTSGSEKNAYRLSISSANQSGIIPNTSYDRYTARLTAQSQLSSKVSSTTTINYTHGKGKRAQQGSNLSGIMLGLTRAPASFDLAAGEENANGTQRTYLSFYDNPYWSVKNNTFNDATDRIIANTALNYYPMDWLKFTLRPGADVYTDRRNNVYAIGSNNGATTLNGQITENSIFNTKYYVDLMATVDKNLTDKINATLILGGNAQQDYYQSLLGRGRNLAIPKFYNLSNASDFYSEQQVSKQKSDALFADLSLSYGKLLFLGGSVRNEWTSTFGPNRRSYFFPGSHLSFVFTELEALKGIEKVLSFGKIRGAYAISAKNPSPYSAYSLYNKPFFTDGFTNGLTFPYNGQNGYGTSNLIANPDLKPEFTKGLEIGTELKFFEARVTLDFTYYKQTTTDIIVPRPVPFSTGHANILDNVGEMANKGVEIELGITPIRTKSGFDWTVRGNFTKNKNEVTKLADGLKQVEIEVGFGDPGVFAKVGQPFGTIYGTTWNRTSDGKLIIGADGLPIISDTLSPLGSPYPTYTIGITNEISYKGFTFSFLIDIRQGGKIWNGTQARLNRLGMSEESADRDKTYLIEGVKDNGEVNDVKVSAHDYWQYYKGDFGATEEAMQDASWIRLRQVGMSYRFKKIKNFGAIELSVSANNLWLKTKYTGVDPDQSLTGASSNYQGIDWFSMPNTKAYNFGIKLIF